MCMLKGTVPWDFRLQIFSWISFPQAPEYTIRAVLKFFKISWRYSQFNVHHRYRWHRWQMKKILNRKFFHYFVWTPFCRRVNMYINFCLQVHFKVFAAWYCSNYLPPVSTTQAKFTVTAGVFDNVGKFVGAAGVIDTGGKFATVVIDTSGASWLANISENFQINS